MDGITKNSSKSNDSINEDIIGTPSRPSHVDANGLEKGSISPSSLFAVKCILGLRNAKIIRENGSSMKRSKRIMKGDCVSSLPKRKRCEYTYSVDIGDISNDCFARMYSMMQLNPVGEVLEKQSLQGKDLLSEDQQSWFLEILSEVGCIEILSETQIRWLGKERMKQLVKGFAKNTGIQAIENIAMIDSISILSVANQMEDNDALSRAKTIPSLNSTNLSFVKMLNCTNGIQFQGAREKSYPIRLQPPHYLIPYDSENSSLASQSLSRSQNIPLQEQPFHLFPVELPLLRYITRVVAISLATGSPKSGKEILQEIPGYKKYMMMIVSPYLHLVLCVFTVVSLVEADFPSSGSALMGKSFLTAVWKLSSDFLCGFSETICSLSQHLPSYSSNVPHSIRPSDCHQEAILLLTHFLGRENNEEEMKEYCKSHKSIHPPDQILKECHHILETICSSYESAIHALKL